MHVRCQLVCKKLGTLSAVCLFLWTSFFICGLNNLYDWLKFKILIMGYEKGTGKTSIPSQPVIVLQHPPDGLRAAQALVAEDETCATVIIFLIKEVLALAILAQMWCSALRACHARQLPGVQFIRFTVKALVTCRTDRVHQLSPYITIKLTCCCGA